MVVRGGPLALLVLLALDSSPRTVGAADVYQYLGNGYCTSEPSGGARPTTFMVEADGDSKAAKCLVESGGQECATVCAETEDCTGFMVQDNSMYAAGLAHVCQIVSVTGPPKEPASYGFVSDSNAVGCDRYV